jgi:hypothetical protein
MRIRVFILSLLVLSTVISVHGQVFAQQAGVNALNADFFTGPIRSRTDLMPLLPEQMPVESRIGIQTHFNQSHIRKWYAPEKVMPHLRALGVKWVRDGLSWARVDNGFDNKYEDPSQFDPWINALKDNRIKLLAPMVGGNVKTMTPQQYAQRFAQYVSYMIERYGDAIGAVQLWNEPNNFGGWRQKFGGKWYGGPWVEPYSQCLLSVAKQLRQQYPDLKIIGGTGIEATTIDAITPAAAYLNAVYIHPYPRRNIPEFMPLVKMGQNQAESMFQTQMPFTQQVNLWMDQVRQQTGRKDLGLWITEFGACVYDPGAGKQGDHLFHPPVDEAMQAKVIARLLITTLASEVQRAFIFLLMDDYTKSTLPGFGLMNTHYQHRPSFAVFGRINAVTRGVVHVDSDLKVVVQSIQAPEHTTQGDALVASQKDIQLVPFKRNDGLLMLAYSAPITTASDTSNRYQSVKATLKIDPAIGDELLRLDLLTGTSETLHVSANHTVNVMVEDYPCLLIGQSSLSK